MNSGAHVSHPPQGLVWVELVLIPVVFIIDAGDGSVARWRGGTGLPGHTEPVSFIICIKLGQDDLGLFKWSVLRGSAEQL